MNNRHQLKRRAVRHHAGALRHERAQALQRDIEAFVTALPKMSQQLTSMAYAASNVIVALRGLSLAALPATVITNQAIRRAARSSYLSTEITRPH